MVPKKTLETPLEENTTFIQKCGKLNRDMQNFQKKMEKVNQKILQQKNQRSRSKINQLKKELKSKKNDIKIWKQKHQKYKTEIDKLKKDLKSKNDSVKQLQDSDNKLRKLNQFLSTKNSISDLTNAQKGD